MRKTALVLGPTGRFGRNAAQALERQGWEVRRFRRDTDTLWDAAWGADVIVNGWNPAYPDWVKDVPEQTQQIIEVAKASGARVVIPGNIYVYGKENLGLLSHDTPMQASNPLGQLRRRMEGAYRDAGVATLVLRAGDFIDTVPSGNWLDKIIVANLERGVMTYPGPFDVSHSWAYLPDLADAMVQLLEKPLGQFEEVLFDGYTLTGREIHAQLQDIHKITIRLKQMNWLPIQLARPFWALAPSLIEMRYLWNTAHSIKADDMKNWLPGFVATDASEALVRATQFKINPNQPMPAVRSFV